MRKQLVTVLLAAGMLLGLTGCQLARIDAGALPAKDRLVGMFITTEHLDLFDMEGYLNDQLNHFPGGELILGKDSAAYAGRLYATQKELTLTDESTGEQHSSKEFVFEGVEGISFFTARIAVEGTDTTESDSYLTSESDEGITDGHTGVFHGDEEEKTTLEGTIYLAYGRADNSCYLNPVYQTADGQLYLTSGNGITASGMQEEGTMMSQTHEETTTVTENGTTKKGSTLVKISVAVLYPPEKLVLVQLDKDNEVLLRRDYRPGTLPPTLTPEPGAAYLIAETYKHDSTGKEVVTRELFDRQNETLTSFFARPDGVCVKTSTQLTW
ncbi:MAG: hypothetical protein RR022_04130 [Angelakisella sp.]